jgi:hypothetical protein
MINQELLEKLPFINFVLLVLVVYYMWSAHSAMRAHDIMHMKKLKGGNGKIEMVEPFWSGWKPCTPWSC